jgi:hypothetical protein
MQSVPITTDVVTCDRLVVLSGYLGSSTYKTDRHDITEILLKVPLNTIKQTNKQSNLGQNREVSHTQVHLTERSSLLNVPVYVIALS